MRNPTGTTRRCARSTTSDGFLNTGDGRRHTTGAQPLVIRRNDSKRQGTLLSGYSKREKHLPFTIAASGGCERARTEISRFAARARRDVNAQDEMRFDVYDTMKDLNKNGCRILIPASICHVRRITPRRLSPSRHTGRPAGRRPPWRPRTGPAGPPRRSGRRRSSRRH